MIRAKTGTRSEIGTISSPMMLVEDEERGITDVIPEGLVRLVTQSDRPDIAVRAFTGLEEARTDSDTGIIRQPMSPYIRTSITIHRFCRAGTTWINRASCWILFFVGGGMGRPRRRKK